MTHSFLLESGAWILNGSWTERDGGAIPIRGKTVVRWGNDTWFTMVTRLIFSDNGGKAIDLQYRGHLDTSGQRFTFVLAHSVMGQVEGEGWLGEQSIVQRYWALQDNQRRSGFETVYRLNEKTYHLSSVVVAGNRLTSTLDATLERQLG